jgi:hypothetical protein
MCISTTYGLDSPRLREEQGLHSCKIQQFSFDFPQQEPIQFKVEHY